MDERLDTDSYYTVQEPFNRAMPKLSWTRIFDLSVQHMV